MIGRQWTLIVSAFVAILVQSAQAEADPKAAPKSAANDYGYVFRDDPLEAGGFGPRDARLRVRERVWRTTLIRCRTDFVSELLKSVEGL